MKTTDRDESGLTEAQAERLHDLRAMAPLTYRPAVDDALIARGLAEPWESDDSALRYGVASTEAGNAAVDAYYAPHAPERR